MITVNDREKIRRAHYIEGKSIRQIQREMGYHRKTIRKALEGGEVPHYILRASRPSPVLDPVKPIINQWLVEDQDRPPKQRHTAKRIYERLKTEYGFVGAESTVRSYVSQRRKLLGTQVFIPLSYEPGGQGQVDFGEAEVIIAHELLKVQLFCMRLGFSKMPFVTALPTQAQEAFLEGHVRAFAFFGGVPHVLVYDNLKAAVKRILEGRGREEQTGFIAFRSHYLFESRFCTPRQGHEKGLVEGLVGYARRNWLVPLPEFDTWADLNAYLVAKCLAEGPRRLRGMELTIAETFALEQPALLPLPARPYACYTAQPVQPDGLGLVSFQTNRYSVPEDHVHEALWLRAFVDRVEIGNGRQTLAVHPRCYGREQDILNPLHYLTALQQRPGAFEQAKPIQQWQKRWPEVYSRYLAALREHLSSSSEAIREFVRILQLHRSYSEELIAQALEQALAAHCFSVDGVKQLILRLTEPIQPAEPLNLAQWPHLNQVQISWPDMSQFDRLLGSQTGGVE
jgi:transposase